MKKRSTQILQRLLSRPNEQLFIDKLKKEYSVSEKTLRNDIAEIETFAAEHKLSKALQFEGNCLKARRNNAASELLQSVYDMSPYDYKMSLEERKVYIIIKLLYQENYCTMQLLADELFVTRNTIINDCKVVGEYLKQHGIEFIANSNKGIKLEGTETARARLMLAVFKLLMPSSEAEKIFFACFIMRKAGFCHMPEDIIFHMSRFTKDNNIILAKDVFWELAICLFVLMDKSCRLLHQCRPKHCLSISSAE